MAEETKAVVKKKTTPKPPAVTVPKDVSAEALIAMAIKQETPIEVLEKLMMMRTQLKEERAREAYFQALTAFQAECPIIERTKEGGTKFKYKYAPLEQIVREIKPFLEKHGFCFFFKKVYDKEADAQLVTCILSHIEGHSESSDFLSPIDRKAVMNDIQKYASSVSYGKRYSLLSVTGVMTEGEDDDAQSTTTEEKPESGDDFLGDVKTKPKEATKEKGKEKKGVLEGRDPENPRRDAKDGNKTDLFEGVELGENDKKDEEEEDAK